ncbi:hypothetical protein KBD11_01825 [Candidatus Saccharibacteria bacterium]|nr:hypothetical protein [Candidatus Saccharibacteria bacterium]
MKISYSQKLQRCKNIAFVFVLIATMIVPYSVPKASAESESNSELGPGDLVIRNAMSSGLLTICRDWNFPSGTNVADYCPSERGFLSSGQDSKTTYKWADVDGIYVPPRTYIYADGTRQNHCRSYGVYIKMSPTWFNHHYNVVKVAC